MRTVSIILFVVACGPKEPPMPSSWANFECKDRKVSYFVVGSMAAEEAGVTIDCNVQGPRVVRWKTEKEGSRVEDSQNMTPGEFENLWKRVEGTGWRHLQDCPPDPGKDVPVYTFEVADNESTHTFQCDSLRPSFPWNTLIDELDQKAATIQGDRGKQQLDDDTSSVQEKPKK